MRKKIIVLSYLCMAAAWVLWSMDPIMIRLIGDNVPRPIMAGVSPLLAGLVLIVPAIKGFKFLFSNKKLLLGFICYILFATVTSDLLYVIAIKNLNPGLVGLVLRSQVVMVILGAWMCFGERPDWVTVSGIFIVVAGYIGNAYVSVLSKLPADAGRNSVLGWCCAFSAALLWASGTLLGKKLLKKFKSRQLCGMRLLSAGIIIVLGYCCTGHGSEFAALSSYQWVMLGVKAVCCTCLAYSLYMFGLRFASATASAAIEQCAPLATLCVATFGLHEAISARQWLWVGVVLLGSMVILWNQQRKPKPASNK